MSNVLSFPPPQAIGFMSGVIIDRTFLLTNPYGYLIQSIDISNDDDLSALPYIFHIKMNVAFTHIVSRRDKSEPAYALRLMNPENLLTGNVASKAFGKPEGAGISASSADVIEIGDNAIIFAFDERKCVNQPGADFVVFTSAKYRSSDKPQDYDASAWRDMTPAKVAVSMDGQTWSNFAATENNAYNTNDPRHYEGYWAGINPTIANSVNNLNVEFASAGGDRFDLSAIGMDEIRYIKIEGKGCKIDAIALLNNVED